MPDPSPNAYDLHRQGVLSRHVLCSGRYVSGMWLKEFQYPEDPASYRACSRLVHIPEIRESNGSILQSAHTRVYVPWVNDHREIYGGGDNPLLRGGLLMATMAIEFQLKASRTSLRTAIRLLRYWEKCEFRIDGNGTGLFFRCRNLKYTEEIEQLASGDEIIGCVLGLYYLFRATGDYPQLRNRIRALVKRLGAYLKSHAYVIVGPHPSRLNAGRPRLQRGAFGLVFFQWALQHAFEEITGNRYEPTSSDYHSTSKILWGLHLEQNELAAENYTRALQGKPRLTATMESEDRDALLGTMRIWALQERHPSDLEDAWVAAFNDRYDVGWLRVLAGVVGFVLGGPFGAAVGASLPSAVESAADRLANEAKTPFQVYKALIWLYTEALLHFRDKGEWFNYALLEHTFHMALSVDSDDARELAPAASAFLRALLGISVTIPEMGQVNTIENDLYAAVIARGLVGRYVDLNYEDRVSTAIRERQRMWPDLPLGEPSMVRTGEWHAPVRWHNARGTTITAFGATIDRLRPDDAKIGVDFCWEARGDGRVLDLKEGVKNNESGMTRTRLREWLLTGRDAVYEAGGLDFLFPRALMALWLSYDLYFADARIRPLVALTGIPFSRDGEFIRATCHGPSDSILRLSGW